MYAVPNTTVHTYRAVTTDDYGDAADDNTTPFLTGVPASVMETSTRVMTADSPTPVVVRFVTGRVKAGTDIAVGDRLQDERNSQWYVVDSIARVSSPFMTPDLRLELRMLDQG